MGDKLDNFVGRFIEKHEKGVAKAVIGIGGIVNAIKPDLGLFDEADGLFNAKALEENCDEDMVRFAQKVASWSGKASVAKDKISGAAQTVNAQAEKMVAQQNREIESKKGEIKRKATEMSKSSDPKTAAKGKEALEKLNI